MTRRNPPRISYPARRHRREHRSTSTGSEAWCNAVISATKPRGQHGPAQQTNTWYLDWFLDVRDENTKCFSWIPVQVSIAHHIGSAMNFFNGCSTYIQVQKITLKHAGFPRIGFWTVKYSIGGGSRRMRSVICWKWWNVNFQFFARNKSFPFSRCFEGRDWNPTLLTKDAMIFPD